MPFCTQAELVNDPNARNGYQYGISGGACCQPDDCSSHLIASVFGGAGEGVNLVPMNRTPNGSGGRWYELERQWRNALDAGQNVRVDIQPRYTTNPQRPTDFIVRYEIDGVLTSPPPIKNTPTGD
ncbi:DNA/RNA non-specific endonuclease [Yoonia sp. F2084L]|uniref:DNA/RNA non-specific endonuclease n=1 Tax=Yoonia sp. F2084L TaxID=2926419 RepID=UPI0032B2C988